ncbi:MAG: hypothetical protein ABR505_10445 [Actinomycetota bacterium]
MVILIGASLLFIVASAGTLVWGWLNGQQTLIWTSIACSAAAGVLLLVAHFKTRRRPVIETAGSAAGGTRRAEPARGGLRSRLTRSRPAPAAKAEAPSAPASSVTPAPTGATISAAAPTGGVVEPEPAVVPATVGAARSRTASKPETGPAPAKRAAASRSSTAATTEVVAVAERKKFHRPDCRYAKAKGAETMSKANARRRGLAPCGICKP